MEEEMREALAALMDITPEQLAFMEEGSSHPYDCHCDKCKEWWKLCGPDPDTGEYGPFTEEELGIAPAE